MRSVRDCAVMLILGCLTLTPAVAYGQSQTLTAFWDPNPPADQITDYEVCLGTTPLSCNVAQTTVPATQTSYTFTPTPGVLYRFAVRAINSTGAGAYSNEVTTSIPNLVQPANQTSTVGVPIAPLTLSVSDPDGGTLSFSHAGLPLGLSINASTGQISGTPTATGTYNVTVSVFDGLLSVYESFTWTVADTTAPALTVTSHTSGQTMTSANVTLSGTATDSAAGGSGIVSVTVNGQASTGGAATGNGTANWSRSLTLSSGANALTIVATDGAGNARTVTMTLTLSATGDTTAPTLAITSHTPGQTVSSSNVTVGGTATDNGAGASGISGVTVNGQAATGGSAPGNAIANWSRSVTLISGSNVITVRATDGAGNARTAQVTLNYTPAAPPSMTSASLTANLASPQNVGTSVTFTASGTGGTPPYEYQWYLQQAGGAWQILRAWSATTTYTWTPTQAAVYNISIWARSAGSTANASQAYAERSFVIAAPPAPSLTNLTSNIASPQSTGTAITFTATAAGGAAPYQFKWWLYNGAGWTILQNWSGSSSYAWTPTQANPNYMIGVWVRNASTTADVNEASRSMPFAITAPAPAAPPAPPAPASPLTAALISNLSSPQLTGTSVTFTAGVSGGTAPYQFKWWLYNGATWTIRQNWSGSSSYTWTPTQANDNYMVGVWVRNAATTADVAETSRSVRFPITAPAAAAPPAPPTSAGPLTITGLTSSLSSPRVTGTSVTFTAGVSGGAAPHQFKWWLYNGATWTILQNWSASSSYTWTPTQANNYLIGVWVRNASTTADANEASRSMPFVITAPATAAPPAPPAPASPAITALTSNVASPQTRGTSITFTAGVSGGTTQYRFKWWLYDGVTWTIVQDWSGGNNFTWRPTQANAYYRIGVWVRSAASTADAAELSTWVPYAIVP